MPFLAREWWLSGIRLPLAALGLGCALPLVLTADAYGWRVLTIAATYALMTMGYQLIFGRLGVLSLAQGAFFGLGAYATAILATTAAAPFWLSFPAAILLPAACAAVIAVPVLRLETHYFALATLGLGQVLLLAATNWIGLTGGANGLAGVPAPMVLGWRLTPGVALAAFAWGVVLLAAWLGSRILSSLYGATLTAVREIPLAAAAAGIDPGAARFAALVLGAAFAGAGGALHAHAVGVVSPEVLELPLMVACLSMAVVGGRGSLAGAVLGAVLLVHLPEWLRFLERFGLFAYGAALLLAILAAPDGITGQIARLRSRLFPEPTPPRPWPQPLPAAPRHPAGTVLLRAEGLTKRYGGVRAVEEASLALAAGEIVGLIGANGSGKTTLLNLMTGLARPDAGRVLLAGRAVTGWAPHRLARAGIARSFQMPLLAEALSVLDNVAIARAPRLGAGLGASLAGRTRATDLEAARAVALAILERFGLAPIAWRAAGDQPPPIRRRIEIARALATEPMVLLLDEPAAGLSAAEREGLAVLLRGLAEAGLGLIVIEHDHRFLAACGARLLRLEAGRIYPAGGSAA